MGTSVSQRSPRTPAWETVRRLYDDPGAPSRIIVARIVQALDTETRAAMADSAVARCLSTLARAGAGRLDDTLLSLDPTLPAAADLAAALRACAEHEIAVHREASQFGSLALDALSTSALGLSEQAPAVTRATLARYADQRRLAEMANCFVAEDLAWTFRHFVERDTPAYVGGPRLARPEDADVLANEVADICRGTARSIPFGGLEDDLLQAVERGPQAGHALYRSMLAQALGDGLGALGVTP